MFTTLRRKIRESVRGHGSSASALRAAPAGTASSPRPRTRRTGIAEDPAERATAEARQPSQDRVPRHLTSSLDDRHLPTYAPTLMHEASKKSTVKRKTIRSNVKDLHFLSERIDETAIRAKLGDGSKIVDRVRYLKKTESSDVRAGTYELQARCNGVWLRVLELIAVGQLDKTIWGRFAGPIGKEQCQTGVLELMKFYKLSVPSSVVLSAVRAKARITSGLFKLKGVRR